MAKQCGTDEMRFKWHELRQNEIALGVLRKAGFDELSAPYQALYKIRGGLMGQLGFKAVKPTTLVMKLVGMSPGTISVWHDADFGWFIEAREKLGAPPVYHRVKDEVAMAVLKGELTHELEAELMTPDEYLGE